DLMLVEVAARLSAAVPADQMVARLGGDEFAVLVQERDLDQVAAAAARVVRAFDPPMLVQGREHHVSMSVGVALREAAVHDPLELLRAADVALYDAKDRGRNRFAVYTADMADRVEETMRLEQRLGTAVHDGEITVVFQPVLALATQRVVGVEALARWSVDGQAVPPDVFIPLAEGRGLIGELGEHVLDLALGAFAGWRASGRDIDHVAVNISPMQLEDHRVLLTVRALLDRHRLPPSALVLEVTESTVMTDSGPALQVLDELAGMGVAISLDDFGTGFSSLARLRALPVSEVKIDRSFVSDVGADEALLRAMVLMARGLGLRTVAEGVETEQQLDALESMGCSAVQGYLLSRPLPEAEVYRRLAEPAHLVHR
ncbi:MAG TPA: bifunctional diguanylate cyclase/phosphodiesterase, partial [Actinomycetes bacterium]|nr:bifunctional diguanylate cyclase/phosphodiesterase [Actinomycetes bacterium]